jgi:hypothetical protein
MDISGVSSSTPLFLSPASSLQIMALEGKKDLLQLERIDYSSSTPGIVFSFFLFLCDLVSAIRFLFSLCHSDFVQLKSS